MLTLLKSNRKINIILSLSVKTLKNRVLMQNIKFGECDKLIKWNPPRRFPSLNDGDSGCNKL
jgi:hypothetical protein